MLLKSIDCSDSEDEKTAKEEMITLPVDVVEMIKSSSLKRSLLSSLDEVMEVGKNKHTKTKWGPILTQKPQTRGHGNVNIMQKAVEYKRKKNLEVPHTYKGNSFAILDPDLLANHTDKINLKMGSDVCSKHVIIDDLIADEREKYLIFANNNPETVLPSNLDVNDIEVGSTPVGSASHQSVGTSDCFEKSPTVLTKVKPCGLSHPFKIA